MSSSCLRARGWMQRELDREMLSEGEARAFQAHLASCPDCARTYRQWRTLASLMRKSPPLPSASLPGQILARAASSPGLPDLSEVPVPGGLPLWLGLAVTGLALAVLPVALGPGLQATLQAWTAAATALETSALSSVGSSAQPVVAVILFGFALTASGAAWELSRRFSLESARLARPSRS